MSGLMVRHAPHLDGTEPIGVWVDVAWSVYLEIGVGLAQFKDGVDSLDEMWDVLGRDDSQGSGPTPEEWGASARAQRGQEALMGMFGGGLTGMAPESGTET